MYVYCCGVFSAIALKSWRNVSWHPLEEAMWSWGSQQINNSPEELAEVLSQEAFFPHRHTYVQPKCVTIKPLDTYVVLLSIEFQSSVCVRVAPALLEGGGDFFNLKS